MTDQERRIQSCIDHINTAIDVDPWAKELVAEMGKEILKAQLSKEDATSDCVRRQAAIDALHQYFADGFEEDRWWNSTHVLAALKGLPSAQYELLTDKEQRIFLAAMGREEKVCEEIDRNHVREPYEDSLMRVCKEIRRKVKSALWT